MQKIDIAGLKIDALSKIELISQLEERIRNNQRTLIFTPYSEFLFHALRDRSVLELLNSADFCLPDGIGIFWAKRFVDIPLTQKKYWLKILEALWQAFYTLLAIAFNPGFIRGALPEKISGSDFVWDLARLAGNKNQSIFLFGGRGDTAKIAAEEIKLKVPSVKVAGWSNKNFKDPSLINDIQNANPDFLFVALDPIKQEKWLKDNFSNLPCKLAIGLGGTFDYIAKKRPNPPKIWRNAGFEWLWRLITQPRRFIRIKNATFGLIWALIKFKVFKSLPFRANAVSVVINNKNEIFVARFNPEKKVVKALGRQTSSFQDYWQLPQGGVKEGEEFTIGAKRELREETNIGSINILKISEKKYQYEWETGIRPLFVSKRYLFKGQQQRIVYFKFFGDDSEIKLDNDELLEWKWVPLDKLMETLHTDKQNLAKIVIADLKEMAEKGILNIDKIDTIDQN